MNRIGQHKLDKLLAKMNKPIKTVNAYNGWDPLKQIILGNVFNPSFFDGVKDSKTKGMLQRILTETQEDLDNYQSEMEKVGVDVIRIPAGTMQDGNYVESMEEILDRKELWRNGGIPRPFITPRDQFITLGNKLVFTHVNSGLGKIVRSLVEDPKSFEAPMLAHYALEKMFSPLSHQQITPENVHLLPMGPFPSREGLEEKAAFDDTYERRIVSYCCDAPMITRFGDTVVVDEADKLNFGSWMLENFPHFKHAHHAIGGHNDGSFCPLKPGHLLTAEWHTDYSETVPGWDVHVVKNDEDSDEDMYNRKREKFKVLHNKKRNIDRSWWAPDKAHEDSVFSKFVDDWLHNWTGWSIESIFEVNALVINPELVFFSNYNKGVFDYCESIGMTPHLVPFRHRHFWDGGLHCLTLDTHREGGMQSYFNE